MVRWPRHIIASLALIIAFGLTAAHSQTPVEWRAAEAGQDNQEMKLAQSYTGVRPGSGNNLPRVEELKTKAGTWVTWPGFIMMEDGSSRLFLQTTVPVKFSIDEKGKKISLKLKNAKVHLRNNRNPLVTVHFNTPLNRAFLKGNRKSLDLIMELRQAVTPNISQTVIGDGYHYLFIDFPKGSYPAAASQNPSFQGYGTGRVPKETLEETPGETPEALPEALPPAQ